MRTISEVLILCCVALATSKEVNSLITRKKSDSRLAVGAQEAQDGEFPYQVSIQRNGEHHCGGALISRTHVLTAAHCVEIFIEDPVEAKQAVQVEVGSTQIGGGEKYSVERISYHPEYRGNDEAETNFLPCDIAVITLQDPVQESAYVKIVKLPMQQSELPLDTKLDVTGFGSPLVGEPVSSILLKDNTYTVSQEECNSYYLAIFGRTILDSHLCAKGAPTHGTCTGDSGGPLVNDKNVIVGIVSGGNGQCGSGDPDVYTKVSHYIPYIQSEMNNSNSPSSFNAINMKDVPDQQAGADS